MPRIIKDVCPQENGAIHDRILTWPNLVTLFGIALIPVYIWQFSTGMLTSLIPPVIILMGLSDALDGYLARKLNQRSVLGEVLDPTRDRLAGLAIIANVLYVENLSRVVVFPAAVVILSEMFIYMNIYIVVTRYGIRRRVHILSKTRQAVHVLGGTIFVVQEYWLPEKIVSNSAIMWTIASASLLLLLFFFKKIKSKDFLKEV